MGRHDLRRRIQQHLHRFHVQRARLSAGLSRIIRKLDIWIQDHCLVLLLALLAVGIPCIVMLLLWKWIQVITLAKQLAPVMTIVSIVITTLLALLRWFRRRRNKRLGPDGGLA
jgi:hypothetical protein